MTFEISVYIGVAMAWFAIQFAFFTSPEEMKDIHQGFESIAWLWRGVVIMIALTFWWLFAAQKIMSGTVYLAGQKTRGNLYDPPSD